MRGMLQKNEVFLGSSLLIDEKCVSIYIIGWIYSFYVCLILVVNKIRFLIYFLVFLVICDLFYYVSFQRCGIYFRVFYRCYKEIIEL